MGLDMYLKANTYVSGWDHQSNKEKEDFQRILDIIGMDSLVSADSPSAEVRVTVAYWRKANQIHNWFVQNVQRGEDDCGDYYVTNEQIEELRDLCQKALKLFAATRNGSAESARKAVLSEILPTASGFFFGSTNYDEWYERDLKRTVEQLTRVLAYTKRYPMVSLYYHSSW